MKNLLGGNQGYNINANKPIGCGIETVGSYNQGSKSSCMPESSLLKPPVPINPSKNNVLKGGRGYTFDLTKPLTEGKCSGNVSEVVPTADNCKPMVDTKPTPLPLDIGTQTGGGRNNKVNYNFIIHPETRKRLSVYSQEGKNLIKDMVKNVQNKRY